MIFSASPAENMGANHRIPDFIVMTIVMIAYTAAAYFRFDGTPNALAMKYRGWLQGTANRHLRSQESMTICVPLF